MAKYISLEIPEPCHENWDQMSPREKGRYCGSCQKTVIDFSGMTDARIAEFFHKNTGNVCGRFHPDQLERSMAVPKKQYPWAKYFFTVAIPAFLLSLKSGAQSVALKGQTIRVISTDNNKTQPQQRKITGIVMDKDGECLAGAGVTVPHTNLGVSTDQNGCFSLTLPFGRDTLSVSCVGYEPRKIPIGHLNHFVITLVKSPVELETVILPAPRNYVTGNLRSSVSYSYYTEVIKHVPEISVHPNPASAKSFLNISWKQKTSNKQYIEIFSANGDLLQTAKASPPDKNNSVSVLLGKLPHGYYILRVTDMKTGEKLSKEFVVL